MSDISEHMRLTVHVRGNVTQNTKGFNKEHTVTLEGTVILRHEGSRLAYFVTDMNGRPVALGDALDALHEEARQANNREIERQRQQQLAELRAA